jgi:hypothetical protein
MDRKIRRYPFKWSWSQAQIHQESTGKYSTSWCPESVSVLRYCLWSFGPCILSWPTRVVSRGSWPPQTPLIQPPPPSSSGGFCLVSFCQEQDTDSSVVEPHSCVESNYFYDLVSSLCTCLCSSISQARVSLLGEFNRAAAWLITRGFVVLRLRGSFLWI